MNRKPVYNHAPLTPDEFFRLFGKMFQGLSVPGSMGQVLGAAREPWAKLKTELNLKGWPTAEESEAAARKVFALEINDMEKLVRFIYDMSHDGIIAINSTEMELRGYLSEALKPDPCDRPSAETCEHGYGFVEYCPDCKALAFNNLINSAEIAAEMWDSNSASVDPEEVHAMLVDALTAAKKFRTGNSDGAKRK